MCLCVCVCVHWIDLARVCLSLSLSLSLCIYIFSDFTSEIQSQTEMHPTNTHTHIHLYIHQIHWEMANTTRNNSNWHRKIKQRKAKAMKRKKAIDLTAYRVFVLFNRGKSGISIRMQHILSLTKEQCRAVIMGKKGTPVYIYIYIYIDIAIASNNVSVYIVYTVNIYVYVYVYIQYWTLDSAWWLLQ